MATERLGMHKLREILRQKLVLRRSHRDIAGSVGISAGAVGGATKRAEHAGLDWEAVTRMSDDARTGVVDANCKVHGLSNLFVAGSSCFVTCGSANPTLTVVALSLRLADHLKKL